MLKLKVRRSDFSKASLGGTLLLWFVSGLVSAQVLPRADAPWVLSSSPITDTLFGPTFIYFSDSVLIETPDESLPYYFDWTNTSYRIPRTDVQIYADGCLVNRTLTDPVFYSGGEQTSTFLEDNYCVRPSSDIYSRFVPLGIDTVAVLYELRRGGSPQAGFFGIFEGLGIAMLSVDSLLANADATTALLGEPEFWLPQDTLLREAVGLSPHPAGGWWVVTHSLVNSNRWHVIRLTADTLVQMPDQFAGPITIRNDDYGVNINFSAQGDHFILKGPDSGNSMYNFNASTGTITHVSTIRHPNPDWIPGRLFTGGAFSASGRYYYYTDERTVWQLDMTAPELDSAWVQINPTARPGRNNYYYQASRAPDCRVFFGWAGGNTALSAIDKPERAGDAVDFKNRGVPTKYYYVGIPQHPNYHLWARARVERGLAPHIDTAVCDSSIVAYPYEADPVSSLRSSPRTAVAELQLWPNVLRAHQLGQTLTVKAGQSLTAAGARLHCDVIDMQGRRMSTVANASPPTQDGTTWEVKLPSLPPGRYTLVVRVESSQGAVARGGFVVQ